MLRRVLASFVLIMVPFVWAVQADDAAKPKSDQTPAAPAKDQEATKNEVTLNQERLARQYREFEQALLTLAQRLERSSKPEDREKAVLLKEAIKKSSEVQINTRFDKLVTLLKGSKAADLNAISDAMEKSQMLAEDIRAILALLMSDNRDAQLKAEKERLRRLLEMLDKVIREQKVVRAQTEGGRMDPEGLKKSQNKVTQATENVAKAMNKDGKGEEGKGEAKNKGQDDKSKHGDNKGKGDDKKGQEGDPKKGQQGDSKNKGDDKKGQEGDSKKGQQGDGKKGQQGDSKKGQQGQQGQQGEEQDQQENTPGRKQVQEATQDQKRAEENIAKKNREDASKNQDDAIKKLEEARKKLEEILRQLREEEMERLLAALQARCEQMLAMQIEVYEGTKRVDKAIGQNSDKKAGRDEELKSLQLSDREQDIVRLANKALELLEAEGSAVAFPEVFIQVRDDMKSVANRLGKVDVGQVTQTIEEDIIATLKEMVEALKKAQQDMQNRRNQPPPPMNNDPNQNRSLIDLIAELKIIRSMQVRVNSRTGIYARQYQGEQASDPDIQKELANLALRQQKIFEVTNNIARGKNK